MQMTRLLPMIVFFIVVTCNAAPAIEDYVVYCDPNSAHPNGIPIYTDPQNRAWVVRYLNCGQQLKVLSVEADVIKIQNDTGVAYIEPRYVRRLTPVSAQPMEPVYQSAQSNPATPAITPQVVAGVLNPRSGPATQASPAEAKPYISRGMNEIFISGLVAIPHYDTGSTAASIHIVYGRYLTDWFAIGPLFSAQFAGSQVHSITAGGVAQFVPRMSDRFYLVAGAGIGANNYKFYGSETNLAAVAYFGPRFFVAQHVALDVQYSLGYRRLEGLGFKDSSASGLSVGFSFIF